MIRFAASTALIPCSLILCSLFVAGAAEAEKAPAEPDDLNTLVHWMTGSFSSQAQAAEDEDYFDIRLEMVAIWQERSDAHWLYVEQAAASSLDKPYRQRVYRVSARDDGAFVSEVFEIPDPLSYAGHWRQDAPLKDLSPKDLKEREGCAVVLRRQENGDFVGSTVEDECKSSLRGASYATSEITIRECLIQSWDRGFDAEGAHVWGAEKGPYDFVCRR